MDELLRRAAADIAQARYAIALTGAGISTESGIPDFRGPNGVWTKNPAAEKQSYQNYQRFLANPKRYWEETLDRPSFLGNLSQAAPNPGHIALAELERMGHLKLIITQNIDNLHRRAGSQQVLEFHGNTTKLRCIACNARFERSEFDLEGLRAAGQLPPACPECGEVLKSDVVQFGEPIPADVADASFQAAARCDLMLICGTSAVVYPFASLPQMARRRGNVTIIEVNAEPTPLTREGLSDYLIQGRTGEILPKIAAMLQQRQS